MPALLCTHALRFRLRRGLVLMHVGALGCSPPPFVLEEEDSPMDVVPACTAVVSSLRVDPPASEIDVGDGRRAGVRFRASAVLPDGSMELVPAAWTVSPAEV